LWHAGQAREEADQIEARKERSIEQQYDSGAVKGGAQGEEKKGVRSYRLIKAQQEERKGRNQKQEQARNRRESQHHR
jgi:hypothetical protein